MTCSTIRYRRWLEAARSRFTAPISGMFRTFSALIGLACLIFLASSLTISFTAYAGKGGVPGSNKKSHSSNHGGTGIGNHGGNGKSGGNGLGNAYGLGNMGDMGATGNSNKNHDISGTSNLRDAAQPKPNSYKTIEFDKKWDAATQLDLEVELNLDDLKRLNTLTNNAADYLGSIVPFSKNSTSDTTIKTPPGLVGKSPPGLVGKSPPGLTGVKLKVSPNGKAIGVRNKETDEALIPVTKKKAPPPADKLKVKAGTYSPHEVLANNLTPEAAERLRSQGFSVRTSSPYRGGEGITVLSTPPHMDAMTAMRRLRREMPNERFHLNRYYQLYRPAMQNNVLPQRTRLAQVGRVVHCQGDQCYAQKTIHWKASFAECTRNIRIGVIDTDVDLRHPTFNGQRITHTSFLPEGRQASPNWHGTGILALLAGRPDSGTPGLINKADFYVASIFFVGDNGNVQTDTVSLVQALDWMRASKVQLVNMSFSGPQDELVHSRITELKERGVVFIAAAGNNGPTSPPAYPAAYPQVIAVTAVDRTQQVFPLAVRGPHIDIAAPGVRIWTAVPKKREGYRSGTSFAVPFVTAVLSLQSPKTREASKDALLDSLKVVQLGKKKGRNSIFGRGLILAPRSCSKSGGGLAHTGASLHSPRIPKK